MKRYLIWILMLLPLATIGQWVNPVSFFHFDQFGDELTQSEMEKIMWDKGYHITGMKFYEWQTLMNLNCTDINKGIRNHWKIGGGVLIEDQATHTLYIDTPASISVVVEKEWRNIFNDYDSDEICKKTYKFVANNLKFSFDETSHSYSFSYTPAGSYSYICSNSNTSYGSTDETFMTFGYVKGDAIGECNGVWVCFLNDLYNPNDSDGDGHNRHYMIFWLEEVMLDPPIKAKDMPKPSSVAHEYFVEDKGVSFLGNNDEHATAAESAVVSVVGTLLALLLGGLAGGAGGAIPLVPPVSSTVPPAGSTSPVDPTKFNPTDYPDYSDKFITQQPDGDLVVRDPVTGKETLYINNGDGTYRNFNTNQDWTPDEINEQLRSRDENSSLLQQDAETAARNVAEQHTAWEEQNARDLERGYSDEQKEFMDWKQEQEGQLKHEEYLDKMALKYHVPPTDKAIMDAIKFEQIMNQLDYKTHMAEKEAYDKTISYLEKVDKTAEFGVNIMAGAVPGGTGVKNAYTFAKSTLVATNESIVEGKSFGEGVAHIVVGMGNGALGVIQNEAGTLTKDASYGLLIEYGITIGTESAKDGFTKYYETGDIGKAMGAVANAASKKTLEFGASKMISVGLETVKGGAADYVDYAKKGLFPDDDWVFTGACKINNLLNKTADFNMGPEVRGIGGSYTTAIKGTVERGAWVENVINEEVKATGVYDGAGKIGEETLDFFKEIKKFSNKAAQFRKR